MKMKIPIAMWIISYFFMVFGSQVEDPGLAYVALSFGLGGTIVALGELSDRIGRPKKQRLDLRIKIDKLRFRRLVIEGKSNNFIAKKLKISPKTVSRRVKDFKLKGLRRQGRKRQGRK